ncbi:P22AR C-terminal domain-containing protein [Yersinia rochesterensis]|uniref:P22AR C-terminal domain-containing protein n=1 Tax=Yersinia rochesterensis TaxID=1604335 RepID=UPI0025AAF5EF|nr:P22AR C-terminal domain-containing protein [Yersinia rochesterensis]MDN0106749.1 P22AR C-terminal domain-containing protein [Yersinia rochesterensis]
MRSSNGEAPTTWNSQGFVLSATLSESTDMKSIANNQLTFHNTKFNAVQDKGQIWLTSSELAKALEYSSSKSISTLFSRNADEFSPAMTQVIEMMTSGNYRKKVRLFSIRGAHLIAMFSTTPVAKEFRKWALDVLDNEVSAFPIPEKRQFTDEELCTLCWLWRNTVSMISNSADVYPILRAAEHRLAGSVFSAAHEYPLNTNKARALLERETAHIKAGPFTNDNWRVLNRLRVGQLLN